MTIRQGTDSSNTPTRLSQLYSKYTPDYVYSVSRTIINYRNKGVFFVKREAMPLPEEGKKLLNHMTCGDIHPNSLEHFCALVEEVMVPILKNEANLAKFPQCISDGE